MIGKKRILGAVLAANMLAASFGGGQVLAADMMNPPTAEVEQGTLRGFMDEDIYTFLGVPYATAERFGMPHEVEPWEGVRDAQAYGPVCPIADQTAVGTDELVWPHRYWIQNENCQNLNIWTPELNEDAKKPVMVFIHGGGFKNGSSIEGAAYDGKNLSEYGDAVIVSVNHRLNVLGFLDLSAYGEEYENSANAGMADLLAALQWIKNNIASFGGDPENITVFGQSGGGMKILTMLQMPEAEGLFDKAIVESTGTMRFVEPEQGQMVAEKTLENLGLDETQIEELKEVPYHDLIEASTDALAEVGEELGVSLDWRPTLDETYVCSDFCDWAGEVPMMMGSVFSEFKSTIHVGDGRKNEWTEEETAANLKDAYGDNAEAIAEEFAKVFPDKKLADAYFYDGARRLLVVEPTLDRKLENASAPVYSYLFSYEAPVNGGTTALHCSELSYVFHNVEIPVVARATGGSGNETALRLQDEMATAWLNFAKTGDPSQEGLEWKAYTTDEKYTMRFDEKSGCSILGDEKLNQLIEEVEQVRVGY